MRNGLGIALVLVVTLLSGCGPRRPAPAAPDQSVLTADQRIRLTAPVLGLEQEPGTVVSCMNDALDLSTQDAVAVIPVAEVTRLWVGERGDRVGTGIAVGAVLGTVAGAGAGAVLGEDDCAPPPAFTISFCVERPAGAVLGALGGAAVGAGIGAIVGSFVRSDTWREVELPVSCAASPPESRIDDHAPRR